MKKLDAKGSKTGVGKGRVVKMAQMDALTAMELEAARRREIVLEERVAARLTWAGAGRTQRTGRRELAWLAAAVNTVALGARVARG